MCSYGAPELKFEIGGVVLSLELCGAEGGFEVDEPYQSFLSDKSPEATFRVKRSPLPDPASLEEVFDAGGSWRMYRRGDAWCVVLQAPALGPDPYQIAVVKSDFSDGDVYTRDDAHRLGLGACGLGRPMLEVLFVNLLSRGRGVLLHACAVSDNDRGFLFAGTSGAGKSTMADLWKGRTGAAILSDDRIVIREMDGRFWAYGTPWHGDVSICSAERVRVDHVFVLRHGDENSVRPLEAPNALTSLFARSFPT
ncbi:MAG TPA: hypothetical protein VM537_02775, partial [Anaerolineae bacterium]|nr:hypothetical protein [Anaerolineae bacterium]